MKRIAGRSRGLSLIELLVVLAIAALLASRTVPATLDLLARASAERTQYTLHAALALARTHAVTERSAVTLCHLGEDGRCDGDWSGELSVFRDPTRSARLEHGDRLLRRFPAPAERVFLRAFRTTRYFRYLASGRTAWQNGRFVVCSTRLGQPARMLVVNVQGRVRAAAPAASPLCAP